MPARLPGASRPLLVFAALFAAIVVMGAASRPPAIALGPVDCSTLTPLGGSTNTVSLPPHSGVTQPLPEGVPIVACSLAVPSLPTYTSAYLRLIPWDVQTMAPNPTTVMIRSVNMTASSLAYGRTRVNFWPPVVTQAVPHVADAPELRLAFDWVVTDFANGQTVAFEGTSASGLPPAMNYSDVAPRTVLGGGSPTLRLLLCDGGAATQDLRVMQGVTRTDEPLSSAYREIVQRFRVPQVTSVGWVEVALGQPTAYWAGPGRIAILDGAGEVEPGNPIVEMCGGAFWPVYYPDEPKWSTHADFDQPVELFPGHDYWILVRTTGNSTLYSRIVTGGEEADFASAIGPLLARTDAVSPWSAIPDRALNFRLLGAPVPATSVGGGPARPSPLRLAITPNPTHGEAAFSWTGANGLARIEVLDARGRRITEVAGQERTWRWNGRDAAGRSVAPGVYFVRVTDDEQRAVTERVVRVR